MDFVSNEMIMECFPEVDGINLDDIENEDDKLTKIFLELVKFIPEQETLLFLKRPIHKHFLDKDKLKAQNYKSSIKKFRKNSKLLGTIAGGTSGAIAGAAAGSLVGYKVGELAGKTVGQELVGINVGVGVGFVVGGSVGAYYGGIEGRRIGREKGNSYARLQRKIETMASEGFSEFREHHSRKIIENISRVVSGLYNDILDKIECPLKHGIFSIPTRMSNGRIYNYQHISLWLSQSETDPLTREPLTMDGSVQLENYFSLLLDEYFIPEYNSIVERISSASKGTLEENSEQDKCFNLFFKIEQTDLERIVERAKKKVSIASMTLNQNMFSIKIPHKSQEEIYLVFDSVFKIKDSIKENDYKIITD
jgi:hypothetical protein